MMRDLCGKPRQICLFQTIIGDQIQIRPRPLTPSQRRLIDSLHILAVVHKHRLHTDIVLLIIGNHSRI